MRSVHNAPTQFTMDREAMRTMFRFLRGSFWMYVLGLLPLEALFVQSAQAHEFVVAISANGTESDLILTDAVRVFCWRLRNVMPIQTRHQTGTLADWMSTLFRKLQTLVPNSLA